VAVFLSATTGPLGVAAARGVTPTQNEVETGLTCQCGCGLTVHSCNHLNCGSAIPLKKEIGEQIGMGRTLPQILSHFENKYGEMILSAPTTRGFNLAAWIVPFVVIGLGGLFVGVILWRWRESTDGDTPPVTPVPSASDDPAEHELRERLERELREREV